MYLPSLSHHVNISLECSDRHLSSLPPNSGGKSTHVSLYHAFCGWQELTIYTQLATIPPLATKPPSAPNPSPLCRNGTELLSTLNCSSTPSHSSDVWYHFIHTPLLLQPVPKVGVPFQNFSTVFYSVSLHCVPNISELHSSPKFCWGKRNTDLWKATRFVSSSRRLCRSRKGYLAGKTKYRANPSILRCDSNSWAYICGNNRLYSNILNNIWHSWITSAVSDADSV